MHSSQLNEKTIFNAARRIDAPDARAEYLKKACGDDPVLHERVALLLRAYDERRSFLESPAPGLAATVESPPAERPGQTIGRYHLLQERVAAD